jgi:hypothetical protein
MTISPTWQPLAEQGFLDYDERKDLPSSVFAFPRLRKEPLASASHVIRALARIKTVHDATDADRDLAFANIVRAAAYYAVYVPETHWSQIGRRPTDADPMQRPTEPVEAAGE